MRATVNTPSNCVYTDLVVGRYPDMDGKCLELLKSVARSVLQTMSALASNYHPSLLKEL